MVRLVLYNLSTSWPMLATYMVLLFLLGCALYVEAKEFKLKERENKNIWFVFKYA